MYTYAHAPLQRSCLAISYTFRTEKSIFRRKRRHFSLYSAPFYAASRTAGRKRSKAVAFCRRRVYTGCMKIASPKLPEQLQPLAAEEAETLLAAEERVYGACLAGGQPLRFPNAAFACTRFSSCSFTAALLKGADFADCVFDRCDFSGADFAGASFRRAEFCECKGVGADLSECSVSDAVFDKCNFSYANLSHAKLRDVRAASCDFSYADLDGCALRNFETDKTRFVRTNFFGTPLKGVDLSSCTLAGLTLSTQLTEIRGATLSRLQCADFLRALGVNIKD